MLLMIQKRTAPFVVLFFFFHAILLSPTVSPFAFLPCGCTISNFPMLPHATSQHRTNAHTHSQHALFCTPTVRENTGEGANSWSFKMLSTSYRISTLIFPQANATIQPFISVVTLPLACGRCPWPRKGLTSRAEKDLCRRRKDTFHSTRHIEICQHDVGHTQPLVCLAISTTWAPGRDLNY